MRRTIYKKGEQPLNLSPFTPSGQLVFSSIKMFSDPQDPRKEYVEEYTPDSADAMKVMRFLDELNGLHWTPELVRIEKELRAALFDLMGAKYVECEDDKS